VPVYADVGEGTYVLSDEQIERAFERYPDIAGAIVPALLGNIPNIDLLLEKLGDKPLILDSCDVMGTKWRGNEVATYGTFAAYSFYGSHHISTFGVGGGVGTNNPEYAEMARSLVFWGRDFSTDGLDLVQNFLRRYSYSSIGLDAQMTAVQAGFGLAQMERLPEYLGQREAVFRRLQNTFSRYLEYFHLPTRASDKADISWFCYPITLTADAPFSREFFAKYLLENKIEIRPVMATILDHEPFANGNYYLIGNIRNANVVARRGFFLPSCPMESDQLQNYIEVIEKFLRKY
jgi:CDP-6-deoxy-D-xylo-4-hexulose-3-dehydrase